MLRDGCDKPECVRLAGTKWPKPERRNSGSTLGRQYRLTSTGFSMSERETIGAQPALESENSDEGEFSDVSIKCIDCNRDFIWTAGEQIFFRDKNLKNPPKRCKPCKQAKNERIAAITAAQTTGIRQKIEVTVQCASCGEITTVPFYPSQGRPVYCRSCFLRMNPSILSPAPRDC